jgi:DNA-binding Lrp family transcriptional regulator
MAPIAYMSIVAEGDSEDKIVKELKDISSVEELAIVSGNCDIFVKIYEETKEKLKVTTRYIEELDNVRHARLLVAEENYPYFLRNGKGEIENSKP